MFSISYKKPAEKFLEKLKDKKLQKRILDRIEILKENPIIRDTKQVFGYKDKVFRVRVGDYRILYVVDFELRVVMVVKIDKRGRAYE